jgi:hypothetical protein
VRKAMLMSDNWVAVLGRSGDECSNDMLAAIRHWQSAASCFPDATPFGPVVGAADVHWAIPIPGKVVTIAFGGIIGPVTSITVAINPTRL